MGLKIFILNPPVVDKKEYIREGRCMQTKSSWAALWMPLSLAYIGAVLRKVGFEIKLLDCVAEKIKIDALLEKLSEFSPEIIVFNTGFPSIKGDMQIARRIKEKFPETKIAGIGVYPTLFEKEFLKEFRAVDFGVMGEPEWVLENLAKSLEKNLPLEKIKGLVFRQGGNLQVNKNQDFSENDLNLLPYPTRDLLKNEAYRLPTNGQKFTLLNIGRGCPHSCIYCTASLYYGKKFRKRSVENVLGEIEECLEKFHIDNFLFWGESFTLEPDYGEALCDEIIKRKLKITWSTTSRVDTLNEKLLTKMKQAGCVLLGLGLESYDQKILDNMKKGTNREKIEKAIALVKKSGIKSMGHFIFGLPGETQETAEKTINFALRSQIDFAQFYCAVPYPKTELGKIGKEKNWIETQDYSQFDLTKSVMRNEKLSAKEIRKIRDRAYRRFYFRPRMVLQVFQEVKSWKNLLSVFNFLDWIKPKRK